MLPSQREEKGGEVRGKEAGGVCRGTMQDAPYLSGAHGWISLSFLNMCLCIHDSVCANHLFSFEHSSVGMSVPEFQSL